MICEVCRFFFLYDLCCFVYLHSRNYVYTTFFFNISYLVLLHYLLELFMQIFVLLLMRIVLFYYIFVINIGFIASSKVIASCVCLFLFIYNIFHFFN